jgi:primosomal protein N' (replication factor Y)
MLYAKVVVGLPVAGPFDYAVEPAMQARVKPGCRVWVPWRNQRRLGYVVGLSKKTNISKVKPIISVIDKIPVLDKNMLILTRQLSDYYCCSWGEAIETALPQALRRGKSVELAHLNPAQGIPVTRERNLLIHDLGGNQRWDIYLKEIKETLAKNKSVILLFPDKQAVLKAGEIIGSKIAAALSILCREGSGELQEWAKAKEGKTDIVVATRSGIFAPLGNLGLVIIDEEQSPVYKQDQVPHYHPREVAFMRVKLQGARLILAGICVSLESFYLAKKSKLKYLHLQPRKKYPELQIIGMRHLPQSQKRGANPLLSKYLQDSIALSLDSKDKILLFLNRRGFATGASCISCGLSLRCPRCSVNLVYHFKDNLLKCHYCNFKSEPPRICPNCNAGYIKYSGAGAEKIESEISRIFPQARIRLLDRQRCTDIAQTDILISSQGALSEADYNFGLIGILSIDNSLNRVDFRAAEKTYQLLNSILRLTDKMVIIQTNLANHHIFTALLKQDQKLFYKKELSQRRQLNFPPYRHLGLIKIRGKKEEKVKDAANALFGRLKETNTAKNIDIISVNCAEPSKLRGNFYWQILLRSGSAVDLSKFLKMRLKDTPHSGIIITVDIDPV